MFNSLFLSDEYSDFVNEIFKARNHAKAMYGSDFLTNNLTVIVFQMGLKLIAPVDGTALRSAIIDCKNAEKWISFLLDNGFYTDKSLLDKCNNYKFYLTLSLDLFEETEKK